MLLIHLSFSFTHAINAIEELFAALLGRQRKLKGILPGHEDLGFMFVLHRPHHNCGN